MGPIENPYIDWITRTGRRTISKTLQIDAARFMIVGSGGFAINFAILFVLHGALKLPLVPSQLLGAESAILSNYYFHSVWTYRDARRKAISVRLTQFHITAWAGSGITTLTLVGAVHFLHSYYLLALAYGSFVGLLWNYLWTKYLIFAKAKSHNPV
jgi:putative flippase GtrA